MEENLDDMCVQYNASRNLEMSQKNSSDYAKWGCFDCDGLNKACEHYVPLKDVKYQVED